MTGALESAIQYGVEWLLRRQHEDGSWGYRESGMAFVEPTSLAVLALLAHPSLSSLTRQSIDRAAAFLGRTQRADGGWPACAVDPDASWMTAYAVWALNRMRNVYPGTTYAANVAAGLRWLTEIARPAPVGESERALSKRLTSIDATLVGWPWMGGDSSWVYPTSISIVACRVCGSVAEERVRQAVDMLFDRACAGGGWNVGNPYMLDKPYLPNAIDTAVALLALHCAGYGESPRVREGVMRLYGLAQDTTSDLSLAWAVFALRSMRRDVNNLGERLLAAQRQGGAWPSGAFGTSLALLALSPDPGFLGV